MIELKPIKTEKTNCTYKAPDNMPDCLDLHLEKREDRTVSTWDIPDVGNIELHVYGHAVPPVSLLFTPKENVFKESVNDLRALEKEIIDRAYLAGNTTLESIEFLAEGIAREFSTLKNQIRSQRARASAELDFKEFFK